MLCSYAFSCTPLILHHPLSCTDCLHSPQANSVSAPSPPMTADLLTVCIVAGPLTILLLLSLLRCGRRKCFRTPHSGQTYLRFETDDGLSSDDPLRQDAQQEEHGFRMASFNGSTGGDRRPWSNFTHDKSGTAVNVRFGNRQRSPLFSQMPEIMEAHVLTVLLVLRFWPAPFVLLPR